jgi:hypothetical protein
VASGPGRARALLRSCPDSQRTAIKERSRWGATGSFFFTDARDGWHSGGKKKRSQFRRWPYCSEHEVGGSRNRSLPRGSWIGKPMVNRILVVFPQIMSSAARGGPGADLPTIGRGRVREKGTVARHEIMTARILDGGDLPASFTWPIEPVGA